MADDILAQAEKLCKPLSEVSQYWRNQSNAVCVVAGDLLPQLLAEAKLWKAKAIEERAMRIRKEFYTKRCFKSEEEFREYDKSTWEQAKEQAARELEEMKHDI